MMMRRPFKVVAVALANKIARIIWALLVRDDSYRGAKMIVHARRHTSFPADQSQRQARFNCDDATGRHPEASQTAKSQARYSARS
jgi:hypothetical protein